MVRITGEDLTVAGVVAVARDREAIEIAPDAWRNVERGRAVVEAIVESGETVYGVTTGLGAQKVYGVDAGDMIPFNNRVLQGHASHPAGPLMSRTAVRAALVVLINQLASGTNGVRSSLVAILQDALARDRLPPVTAGGSMGSADLTPMAQLATGILAGAGFEIEAKEAVALMNNNATSLGRGTLVMEEAGRLHRAFDLAAAMSLEGFQGTPSPYMNAPLASLERAGRAGAGRRIRAFLAGSHLWNPDVPRFIQDPLSFRCVPAIHGTADRAMGTLLRDWEGELNVANDNPMMDLEEARPVSHGNMESSAETLVIDVLRLLNAKLANVSGERQHKLHWPAFAGLTEGLADEATAFGGVDFLNLGHIGAAHVCSVAVASQPVLPVAAGQVCNGIEDAAGFAMQSTALAETSNDAAWMVVTLEMIIAGWSIARRGIDDDRLGVGVRAARNRILPFLPIGREGEQRFEIAPIVEAVRHGDILGEAESLSGANGGP